MRVTMQFFDDLFQGQDINFRCIRDRGGKTKIRDYQAKYSDVYEFLERTNDENYETYFVVNNGGYKDRDINSINAVFIDLDCGKDENKKFYSLEEVDVYKRHKIDEMKNFSVAPSYIVETRNGLHCYWLLDDGATREQFMKCEERLISFFNADKSVRNLCNLMRVPDTYWCKDQENKFKIEIIEANRARYNIMEIIKKCPIVLHNTKLSVPEGFGDSDKKKDSSLIDITVPKPRPTSQPDITPATPNWRLIQYRQPVALRDRLSITPVTLHNHNEMYDLIKKQDLAGYLGVSKGNFPCLFHKDNNPSAKIYISEETEHQIYYCYSDNCKLNKKGKNIIQLTELLTSYNRYKALGFLREVYNVTYHETEWQKEHRGILEENQRLIMSSEFEVNYEDVYKRIKDYLPELYTLNGLAKDFIVTEAYTTTNGNPIFYASNNYLSAKFTKDVNAVSKHIGLFTYLGLLDKLKDTEVPEFLYRRAKQEAAKKNQKQTIQFYSVPAYGELSMTFSMDKANEYTDKGFTMKAFGRELLLRTLGEEEANRVYPKAEGKQISKANELVSSEIEQYVLSKIKECGWVTEKEVHNNMKANHQRVNERQLKMMLPELLDKYGLVKTRLNKKLKSKINFEGDSNSFPNIIHMPQLLDMDSAAQSVGIKEARSIHNVITPRLYLSRKERKLKAVNM